MKAQVQIPNRVAEEVNNKNISESDVAELTDEELKELADGLLDMDVDLGSHPQKKEKEDLMHFFNNVLDRTDTTKVSNLGDEELEAVRKIQRAGLLALSYDMVKVASYIRQRGEIILATGLSGKDKGGFFLKVINTSRKLLESVTSRGSPDTSGGNKGWFKRGK